MQKASFEAQTSLFYCNNKHLNTNRTLGQFTLTNQTKSSPETFLLPLLHVDGMEFEVN